LELVMPCVTVSTEPLLSSISTTAGIQASDQTVS
jgi:hypothetical protein